MQPVPARELDQVSGGTITVRVIPVVQINIAVLQNNVTQVNWTVIHL